MAATDAKHHHDYHLVNPSPWPVVASIFALIMMIGAVIWMRSMSEGAGLFGITGPWVFAVGAVGIVASAFVWWRDVIREGQHGDHTPVVQLHFRYGMILFIASEVMFFVAWFWAYFDAALFPAGVHDLLNSTDVVGQVTRDQLLGGHWPPAPVEGTGVTIPASGAPTPGVFQHTFDPWGIPLLNTLILLTSGVTVTWAHHALLKNDRRGLVLGLILTVILGATFTFFQAYEYQPRRLQLRRPHLRLDVLHGDGLPRRARADRHDLPARLPHPRDRWRLHAEAALRLRGGGLVLALRRRRLAVPVCLHLRVGCGCQLGRRRPLRRRDIARRPVPGLFVAARIRRGGHRAAPCYCRASIIAALPDCRQPGRGARRVPEQQSVSPLYAAVLARCPRCGKGRLFKNVLEMRQACDRCGLDYRFIDTGDGPAVFAIFILGFVILGLALYVEFTYLPSIWVHVVLWGLVTPLIALVVLRFLKSMLIALQYRHKAEEGRIARD